MTGNEIYVGAYVLRIGAPEGALVTPTAPEARPRPAAHFAPARSIPPAVTSFFDRREEIDIALTETAAGRSVEFYAVEGAGKSTLLAHVARHLSATSSSHGALLLSGRRATVDDLVQAIAERLFGCRSRVKFSASQLRDLMVHDAAMRPPTVILLDDVELDAEGVEALIAAAPGCTFVLASPERRLWRGRSLALEGLAAHSALELFEHASGRPVPVASEAAVRELVEFLGGDPQRIVLAAGLARVEDLGPDEIHRRLRTGPETIETLAVELLQGDERRMATALAALGGTDAAVGDLAAIAGTADAELALDALARRGVARRWGGRFRMPHPISVELKRRIDLEPFEERAAARLAESTARFGNDPEWAIVEAPYVLEGLERAVARRRWDDALEIAREVEGGFALAGRWGFWGRVLDLALQAARHRHDPAAEGWVLHERGTRALCMGEAEQARQNLEGAIVLRESIGDLEAAAGSRRNLEQVHGAPLPLAPLRPPPAAAAVHEAAPLSPWFFLALALGIVGLVTIVLLGVFRRDRIQRAEGLVVGAREIDYGERAVGVPGDPRRIVIANEGERSIRMSSVRIGGEAVDDYSVVQDDCTGRTLSPGGRCSIMAVFVPRAAGPRTAVLAFEGGGESGTVALAGMGTGTAVEEATLSGTGAMTPISPARVDFGAQDVGTASGQLPVSFLNARAVPAQLAVRLDAGADREFTIVSDACSSRTIPSGSSCIVKLEFRPRAAGTRGAVLLFREVATNDTWTVPVSGTAVADGLREAVEETVAVASSTTVIPTARPTLAGPEQLTFGSQRPGTRSAGRRVVLQNELEAETRIASVRLTGLDTASFGLGNDRCSGSILRARASCSLEVWFEPADPGPKRSILVVRDGEGLVAHEVVLIGTGG